MSFDESNRYIDAKARIVRALARVTTFMKTSNEFDGDQTSVSKRAKLGTMLSELNAIRKCVEDDIQLMETAVGQKNVPETVQDNSCSSSLIDSFDTLYYDLAAVADVHKFSLVPKHDASFSNNTSVMPFSGQNNMSIYQLPKRKFPTFSGELTKWQGFENLFQSILSHTPELLDVEKFEYLKTSLEGEALALISHLSMTSQNYHSAWDILNARYGNKRDLAKIHIDALLVRHKITFNDAASIKNVINTILEHTAALDNLTFITRQWSPILVHIFEQQLDYELRSRWELVVGDQNFPRLSEFVDFLRRHVRSAEIHSHCPTSVVDPRKQQPSHQKLYTKVRQSSSPQVLTTGSPQASTIVCVVCKSSHSIRQCPCFQKETPSERFLLIKKLNLCINCLGTGHSAAACPSKHTCNSCQKRHHSLLHFSPRPTSTESKSSPISMLVAHPTTRPVLLSTLLVEITSLHQEKHTCRALLDTGAQVSFITKQCADRLSLPRRPCATQINAFSGALVNVVSGVTSINMQPIGKTNPLFCLEVFIVSKITDATPQSTLQSTTWPHLINLELADPTFHTPGQIDILLGADIAPSILTGTRVAGHSSQPTAFGTPFGWILMGPAIQAQPSSITSLLVTTEVSLDSTLTKFWEMEEPPHIQHLSPDEVQAENLFKSSIQQLKSGRFSVALPFKSSRPILGDSRSGAMKRFHYLEQRLDRDSSLKQQYMDFMTDYIECKHMELIPFNEKYTPYCYYIPHHCIVRPDSQTTKLRVVFDASASTTTGQSLNNSVYTGMRLQQDLPTILIRARVHKILFTADIKQMYRQVEIRQEDRDYLRILWRFNNKEPIDEYRLCTVTYGTSCAPYQALRTLQYLATLEETRFPVAANVIKNDTFVDDILTGAETETDALKCQKQLISLCAQGQFYLRKWASNSHRIIEAVPSSDCSMSTAVLFDDEVEAGLKILGMQWNPKQDHFSYKCHIPTMKATKRAILSDLARIFDPLGFLAPITFLAKHMIQLLWTSGINWDEPIPHNISTMWQRYQHELATINQLQIPRRVTLDGDTTYELHAFSDSSEKGYAAAIYLRCASGSEVQCYLITAKSKVSPLKRVTIPRLELCGALLAAKLLHFVHTILTPKLRIENMHAWTDSTTALAWIKSSPHKWSTFIANRTSQLQSLTPPSVWRYVPTGDNPVDCASRGLYPSELLHHPLWWVGPNFLSQNPTTWPPTSTSFESDLDTPEARQTILLTTTTITFFDQLLVKFSSLQKILRIIAYCIRTFQQVKSKSIIPSPVEIAYALKLLILSIQQQEFPEEHNSTKTTTQRGHSNLRGLNVFIDEYGILRVGGRISNADIPYEQKHPILLPRSHRFTDLIVQEFHQQFKHPGAATLQSIIQQQYWIVSSRKVIRSRLRHCIACFKIRPREVHPQMGNLPKVRLQQIKPFMSTGVDYAGPVILKSSKTRRSASTQAYICLFVCMSTKSLHLEVASDLSTETFLLAFSRFLSRRGPIQHMYSDCGTNFVGAANLYHNVEQFTNSPEHQRQCKMYLTSRNISWHFNPPSSPHFGGLWEAGVKSVKTLMYRTIGLHRLTYEELATLLCRIEVTLNSRPLGALSADPRDFEPITPSHFLTLMSSTDNIDPDLTTIPISRLQRWRLIKDIHAHFWKRWQNEYLQTLQRRTKWTNKNENLTVNTLVLIREQTAPLRWKLGRIIHLHPGQDGIVRVATVQTATGILKRPIVKLCPLPMD